MRRSDSSCRGKRRRGISFWGASPLTSAHSHVFMVENDWNVPLHLSKYACYISRFSFTRGISGHSPLPHPHLISLLRLLRHAVKLKWGLELTRSPPHPWYRLSSGEKDYRIIRWIIAHTRNRSVRNSFTCWFLCSLNGVQSDSGLTDIFMTCCSRLNELMDQMIRNRKIRNI